MYHISQWEKRIHFIQIYKNTKTFLLQDVVRREELQKIFHNNHNGTKINNTFKYGGSTFPDMRAINYVRFSPKTPVILNEVFRGMYI